MSESCRSDCRAEITRRVLAISGSGRVWVSSVCGDDEHLAASLSVVKSLGFTVKSIEEAVSA